MTRPPLIGYGAFRTGRSLSSESAVALAWMIPFIDDVGTHETPAAVTGRLTSINAQGE